MIHEMFGVKRRRFAQGGMPVGQEETQNKQNSTQNNKINKHSTQTKFHTNMQVTICSEHILRQTNVN